MPWAAAAVVGGALIGAYATSEAADTAADAQKSSADRAIGEQRRQFDAVQKLLAPYSNAAVSQDGKSGSLIAQQDLLGLNGRDAQQAAIKNIQDSAQFGELYRQGESAILQNAAATGGLRGGNVQAALAQFRPQLLNQLINEQYTKLGGITSIGQNAAAGQGNAGMQSAAGISALMQQQGAAQAGRAMAQGQAWGNMGSALAQAGGIYAGSNSGSGGLTAQQAADYRASNPNGYDW